MNYTLYLRECCKACSHSLQKASLFLKDNLDVACIEVEDELSYTRLRNWKSLTEEDLGYLMKQNQEIESQIQGLRVMVRSL